MRFLAAAKELRLYLLFLLFLYPFCARAQEGDFEVVEIRLSGLVNVQPSTVLGFVGFERGDTVDEEVLASTVARLFETGLFRDIEILRDGDAVLINLVENPTIRSLRFEGMENLDEDLVLELLETQDIAPGRIYRRGSGSYIERVILDFYRQNSRFLAAVEVVTAPLPDNQVGLVVNAAEGPKAVVQQINIYGNEVFSDSDIKDFFQLKESDLIVSFFDNDVFTREGFEGDLGRLRRNYLNAGYVRFLVLSTDVRVQAESGGIVIDIFISEGAQYSFAEPVFEIAGDVITEEMAKEAATFMPGESFSDRLVEQYRDRLREMMRNEGYAFARAEAFTNINDDTLEVEVAFSLEPDSVAEVNRIRFVGNNLTRDIVLRRQLEIVEGERFSAEKLEYSLTRLRRSGYLSEALASERRVDNDKVDIDIDVTEQGIGNFVVGAGYSSSTGVQFSVDFARNNIFGTGNDMRVELDFQEDDSTFRFEFEEPGITDSGITRNFALFLNSEKAESSVVDDDISNFGSALTYTVPIDRNWSWDTGVILERSEIQNASALLARRRPAQPFDDMSKEYVERFGDTQDALRFVAGLAYDSRDRAIGTTEGARFSISSETTVPPSDVNYYLLRQNLEYFQALDEEKDTIFYARVQSRYGDSYGDGIFPYYKRLYILSGNLRGFDADEIGPIGDNNAIGGQMTANANFEVERKMRLFGTEGVRAGMFMDVAGLWHDFDHFTDTLSDFRASAGVLVKIQTPVFPLAVSYGIPLRKKTGDPLERFQFRIGF